MWLIFRQVQTLSWKTFQMICCFNIMRGSDVYWLSHRTSYNRLIYITTEARALITHSHSCITLKHLCIWLHLPFAYMHWYYYDTSWRACSQAWMLLSNHKCRNYNFSIDFSVLTLLKKWYILYKYHKQYIHFDCEIAIYFILLCKFYKIIYNFHLKKKSKKFRLKHV